MTEPDINIIGTFLTTRDRVGEERKPLAYLLHNVTIEVEKADVQNARALDSLDSLRLRLNGHFEVKKWVTGGGRTWVFKVHQATKLGEIGE